MAFSIRDLKRRMKSVKNTGQITRAMEAVSATKMRKSQQVALAARPYAASALELLERLSEKEPSSSSGQKAHWLLETRPLKKAAVIVVTSDKGLCGVLNGNVLRAFEDFKRKHEEWFDAGLCDIITVGKYGASYLKRKGLPVVKAYDGIGDIANIEESRPLAQFVLDSYAFKTYDAVFAIYTNYISVLKQEAKIFQVLPLTKKDMEEMAEGSGAGSRRPAKGTKERGAYDFTYILEPSPQEILDALLPKLVEVRLYHMLLEANASEHSARMLAMKNASDNAKELLDGLQLSFNKARQAGITREIAEITGGAAALEMNG